MLDFRGSTYTPGFTVGIMESAPENFEPGNCHYIPHHPVVNENKDTTKVRIVFDASAKSEGPSLNDCLYKVHS